MRPIKIITDSVADVPKELAEEWGITVLPLTIHLGPESFSDGEGLNAQGLFERLAAGAPFPTTSQVTPASFIDVYQRTLAQGYDVLSIHMSGKLSGTCQSAKIAALDVDPLRIAVVDSLNVTAGEYLLVYYAHRCVQEGKSLREIEAILTNARERLHAFVALDTLENLQRSGRVGKVAGFVGGMLGIKPILEIKGGELVPVAKERGKKKALKFLLDRLKKEDPQPDLPVVLCHSMSPESLDFFKPVIKNRGLSFHTVPIGGVVGAHVGPKAAAYFLISRQKEQA
ncbi:DegV family protein [Clostridiaceae bacterium JG1575]|nr:DegV family protein [Clostridiaceae bacterium JG1575]